MNQIEYIQAGMIEHAALGDVVSQGVIYRQFAKPMFNICLRMTGNKQLAEDVLHDSFIIAFKELRTLKDASKFPGWLKKIVVRQSIKGINKSRYLDSVSDNLEIMNEQNCDDWIRGISFEKINEAITMLPEGCRQVFNLYAVENWSHKEVSEEIGISESTSKSQYQRARKLLQQMLLKEIENG